MLPGPLVLLAMNPWWPAGIVAVVAAITYGLLWTRRKAETAKAVDLYRFLFENALEPRSHPPGEEPCSPSSRSSPQTSEPSASAWRGPPKRKPA